jgi:hypothetical protein
MTSLSKEKIADALGAVKHSPVNVPFYYAPPFLDELQKQIKKRLTSSGGRPTLPNLNVIRKTRYSEETWKNLTTIAESWSKSGGVSVSASQVASIIVEQSLKGSPR